MDIPSYLETQIREGNVVLLLGSGASRDATNPTGEHPPCGNGLGNLLSDRFLGGKYKDKGLSQISELAISESDLRTVQEFIRDLFEPFEPTETHKKMSTFPWWGLATTNYDLLVERGYRQSRASAQKPVAYIENGERVEDRLRDPSCVLLLKLHGCITRIANPQCPLILTPHQYIEYRKGRDRIFDRLKNWAYEKSIVFIGHSLDDSDIRHLLLELNEIAEERPRFYAVAPDVDDIKERFWNTKRVTLLKGTFEEFIDALDARIDPTFRGLTVPTIRDGHRIYKRIVKKTTLSGQCLQFLKADADYVSSGIATRRVKPVDFYHGYNPVWSAIEQQLDAKRPLTDSILVDHFIEMKDAEDGKPQFILVKAHAGAGKSVLLQRLAWDAATEFDCLCLFIKPSGLIDATSIQELIGITTGRLFLFVDDVADHEEGLESLFRTIGPEGGRLTVIGAERINEWSFCEGLDRFVTDDYEMGHLSSKEIDSLLALLEKNSALGTLEHLGPDARKAAFVDRVGRQLLVALHEAMLGRPFEDIVEDEFNGVRPDRARAVYLTICILNRLNIPVRAGIVARVHGIAFQQFQRDFFGPLERVVFTRYDYHTRDYVYAARHPHIAQIVFERILKNADDRFDMYLRCLDALNIDYKPDHIAFSAMVKGRTVLDLFPSHEIARQLYATAREKAGDAPFLLQQMAVYEMQRPQGNLIVARDYLTSAIKVQPHNASLMHSLSELYLSLAERARNPIEEGAYLDKAQKIASDLKRSSRGTSHGHHTLIKISLKRLRDAMDEGHQVCIADLERLVKDVERATRDALQAFPGDSYILDAESKLADLLADSERCIAAMEKAFGSNPRSPYLAVRLARYYGDHADVEKGKATLKRALDANRGEIRLHYAYAKLLIEHGGAEDAEVSYHLQRSFTPGDYNYAAQLLYARQLFLCGKGRDAKRVFRQLANASVGPRVRNQLNYSLEGVFQGGCVRREPTYCFVARDGSDDWIHLHQRNVAEDLWESIRVGTRVKFRVGFTFKGTSAFNVSLEA